MHPDPTSFPENEAQWQTTRVDELLRAAGVSQTRPPARNQRRHQRIRLPQGGKDDPGRLLDTSAHGFRPIPLVERPLGQLNWVQPRSALMSCDSARHEALVEKV